MFLQHVRMRVRACARNASRKSHNSTNQLGNHRRQNKASVAVRPYRYNTVAHADSWPIEVARRLKFDALT